MVVSFGMSLPPTIFQQAMESVLQVLSGVWVYLDNMQVSGSTVKEHFNHLDSVLCKFKASCFTLKERNACVYGTSCRVPW